MLPELLGPIPVLGVVFGVVFLGAVVAFLFSRRKKAQAEAPAPTTAVPAQHTTAVRVQPTAQQPSTRREYRAVHTSDGGSASPAVYDSPADGGGGDGGGGG